MKDRIGNTLAVRDKVIVSLPESFIIGFIADLKECGLVSLRRGTEAGGTPGHVLVQCVLSLPVDPQYNAAAQLVKVYDADKHEETLSPLPGTSEPSRSN